MADESRGIDPYEAVIADLKAKRDQIDQTIRTLQTLRSPGARHDAGQLVGARVDSNRAAGLYLGLSIPDAAKKLLSIEKQALGNADIAKALQAGGVVMNSSDPANTIGSVLTRRFNTVGDIVRVGRGIWGLAEWYPNRTFKKKAGTNGDDKSVVDNTGAETPTDSNEPEQPSEPSAEDLLS